jgi:hypothetical protein
MARRILNTEELHDRRDTDGRLQSGPGYVVFRRLVPNEAVERALRLLNLEIATRGLTAEDVAACSKSTYFPHLRWEREVIDLRAPVERVVTPAEGEEWADPQLLLRFPDAATDWPLVPHVDGPPPWAPTRTYRAIAGVALSRSSIDDGCLWVWPRSHWTTAAAPAPVELDAGDVVVMHPSLRHCSTLNTGGRIRYAVYFRLLGRDGS